MKTIKQIAEETADKVDPALARYMESYDDHPNPELNCAYRVYKDRRVALVAIIESAIREGVSELPMDGLGEKLVSEIVKQGMIVVNYPDPDVSHLFVWAGNCGEQLEGVVANFLAQNSFILRHAAFALQLRQAV